MDYDKLYQICPFIYSNQNNGCFDGLIALESKPCIIKLFIPSIPDLDNLKLNILDGEEERELRIPKNKYKDIFEFAENLQKEVEDCVSGKTDKRAIESTTLLENEDFLNEIKIVESSNTQIFINKNEADCGSLLIKNITEFENHFLKLGISAKNRLYVIESSLPVDDRKFFDEINLSSSSLTSFVNSFTATLMELDDFYANMHTIDTLCYVVDQPNLKSNTRTIKFNERVHIKLTVDPFNTSSISVNIIGPINDIAELRERYTERVQDWDTDLDIYKNLLKIFDLMYFPMKTDMNEEHIDNSCKICYSYRIENEVPLIVCDSVKCNSFFHASCLREWFTKTKNTKSYFSVTFGICPYCKNKISTKLI